MDVRNEVQAEYIAVKALENGVTIIGLTRGRTPGFIILKSWTGASDDRPVYRRYIGNQDTYMLLFIPSMV